MTFDGSGNIDDFSCNCDISLTEGYHGTRCQDVLTKNPGTVLLGGYSASQQNPTGSQDGIVENCNGNDVIDVSGNPICIVCQTGYAEITANLQELIVMEMVIQVRMMVL